MAPEKEQVMSCSVGPFPPLYERCELSAVQQRIYTVAIYTEGARSITLWFLQLSWNRIQLVRPKTRSESFFVQLTILSSLVHALLHKSVETL